jgi:photosystem II stability/assembly factor-like uncharacterized protein
MTLPQIALLAALCCASVPLALHAPWYVVALTMLATGGLMAEWIAEAKEG